jgi:hypothetical protein
MNYTIGKRLLEAERKCFIGFNNLEDITLCKKEYGPGIFENQIYQINSNDSDWTLLLQALVCRFHFISFFKNLYYIYYISLYCPLPKIWSLKNTRVRKQRGFQKRLSQLGS